MAKEYRYTLRKKGSKKRLCPGCGKKTFENYIDSESGHTLPEEYGRCDREVNCTYHLNPYSNGYAKMIAEQEKGQGGVGWIPKPLAFTVPVLETVEPSYISVEVFKQSRANYTENNLAKWLVGLFGEATASNLIGLYYIGTSKHWNGSTVFWQIDTAGKVRSGKIMLYDPSTGKRVKKPFNHITWAHKSLALPDYELKQCFFGEHLLKGNAKPVGLVESEKTALIATVYLPQFIWLAVGSLSNLNNEKCQALQGRKVFLFPDLGGFDKWVGKAGELSQVIKGAVFEVSRILEDNATDSERRQGLDIADYLIRFNPSIFAPKAKAHLKVGEKGEKGEALKTKFFLPTKQAQVNLTEPKASEPENLISVLKGEVAHETNKDPASDLSLWPVQELENYFKIAVLPTTPITLNRSIEIKNAEVFVKGHLTVVRANAGKPAFIPYLERIQMFKSILQEANL